MTTATDLSTRVSASLESYKAMVLQGASKYPEGLPFTLTSELTGFRTALIGLGLVQESDFYPIPEPIKNPLTMLPVLYIKSVVKSALEGNQIFTAKSIQEAIEKVRSDISYGEVASQIRTDFAMGMMKPYEYTRTLIDVDYKGTVIKAFEYHPNKI